MKNNKGRFRCSTCGIYFNLDTDDMDNFENGYYTTEPDTCDECFYDSHEFYIEHQDFSDADPGL